MRMAPSRDRSFLDLEGATPLEAARRLRVADDVRVRGPSPGQRLRYVALAGLIFAAGADSPGSARTATAGSRSRRRLPPSPRLRRCARARAAPRPGTRRSSVLAVVWVALMLDRRALLLITACAALMFALPLVLIGAPDYPSSGWRGAILLTIVALVVGEVAQRSVMNMRHQTAEARSRSRSSRRCTAPSAPWQASRARSPWAPRRASSCAWRRSRASTRRWPPSSSPGSPVSRSRDRRASRSTAPRSAASSRLRACRRSTRAGASSSRTPRRTVAWIRPSCVRPGLESIVYEPILRDGESVGVLAVGWDYPPRRRRRQDRRDHALPRGRGRSLHRASRPPRPARRARAQRPADRTRQPPHLERRDHERDARPDCALRRDDRSRPLQAVQRRVRPRRRRPAPESQRGSVAEPSAQRRRPCPDRRRGVRRPAPEMLRSQTLQTSSSDCAGPPPAG